MPRIVWMLISCLLPNLAGAANLEDFAFQAPLSAADQDLQRVELPIEVIVAITRTDLGDVAVFNQAGKQLPHAITKAPKILTDHSQELPFHEFSRFQQQRSKVVTTREQNQQSGQISELETTETIAIQSERKNYLIELSPDDDTPEFSRIDLQWKHEPASQLLLLKVEYGTELDNLRTINSRKTLANRESDDLNWRSISGIPRNQKYLRLTPDESITRFELNRVDGFYQETQAALRLSYPMETVLTEEDDRPLYFFENPSRVRAESMRVVPPDSHSIISGAIYTSRDEYDKRQTVHSNFKQHNINDDEVVPSEPIVLRRSLFDKVWLNTGGELSSPPRVELVYPQFELIFLGDGNGPYRLAWGNHESEAQVNNLTALLEDNLYQAQQRGTLVTLGQTHDSGGQDRLAPKPELPWQKWLLWAVLVLVALVTGRMALKLYREMNQQSA